jgi:outer membrane protein assembly factor BamB
MNQNVTRFALAAILVVSALVGLAGEEPKKEAPKDPPPKTDITDEAKSWSSDKYLAPPTKFRTGHVTPRELDEKALSKTDAGFVVQLPSKAPIPTPTVYKGKVYVSGGFHSKEFYCFDAETGKFVWAVNLDDDGPTAAVCDDGVALFNTESCTLFAVDAATGKHLWSYYLGDPLTSTPTIANGMVFTSYPARGIGGQQMNDPPALPGQPARQPEKPNPAKEHPPCSHVLVAFDLKTGKIIWQRWIDSDVMSAPVAVDDELYATSFSGTVYKFKQKGGTILSAVKSRATSAPVIVGKDVYLTKRADDGKGPAREANASFGPDLTRQHFEAQMRDAQYLDDKVQDLAKMKAVGGALDAGNGFAGGAPAAANLNAAKGNIGQSNVSTMQAFQGSRFLCAGGQNYNCMGDELLCTDPKTGNKLWGLKLEGDLKKEGGFLAAPPAAAGGQIFLTTLKGDVLQVEPEKGKITKTYKVSGELRFQPAIEGGRIYVGTQDGKLVCISTGDAKLTGWPCWGGNAAHTGAVEKK